MNCKQGDLAVIVRSYAGNEGALVTCLAQDAKRFRYPCGQAREVRVWVVDRTFTGWAGEVINYIPDDQLRPIRDNDGEDEMLRIAGKPREVEKT